MNSPDTKEPHARHGIDTGGTFTDFFAHNQSTGETHVGKWPSTPANPAQAILDGLQKMSGRHGIALAEVDHLAHGTTVGTNALIQRRGGRVAGHADDGEGRYAINFARLCCFGVKHAQDNRMPRAHGHAMYQQLT